MGQVWGRKGGQFGGEGKWYIHHPTRASYHRQGHLASSGDLSSLICHLYPEVTWYGHIVWYLLSQSVTSFLPSSALIVWADILQCCMIWPYRANWRLRPPLSCIGGLNLYTWLEEKTGVTTCKVLMWPLFWLKLMCATIFKVFSNM